MSESFSRILVVDDDDDAIAIVSRILTEHDLVAVPCHSAKEALLKLASEPDIALALIDAIMPEMDGYELARAVRANPKTSRLPILMLTRKRQHDDVKRALSVGASDYIIKPVDPTLLLEKVQNSIRRSAAIQNRIDLNSNEPAAQGALIVPLSIASLNELEITLISPAPITTETNFKLQLPIFEMIGIPAPRLRPLRCDPKEGSFLIRLEISGLSPSDQERLRNWLGSESSRRELLQGF